MNNTHEAKTKKPFWKKWWVWVVIVVLFIGVSGQGNKTQQSQTTSPTITKANPAFDIPMLVGKDIDEVKTVLGKPKSEDKPTAEQIKLGYTEINTMFQKNGVDMLTVTSVSDNKVTEFFISTDDPSGQTQDKKRLLELANAKDNDPRYKVEFVKVINDSSNFTGVKIIPN